MHNAAMLRIGSPLFGRYAGCSRSRDLARLVFVATLPIAIALVLRGLGIRLDGVLNWLPLASIATAFLVSGLLLQRGGVSDREIRTLKRSGARHEFFVGEDRQVSAAKIAAIVIRTGRIVASLIPPPLPRALHVGLAPRLLPVPHALMGAVA